MLQGSFSFLMSDFGTHGNIDRVKDVVNKNIKEYKSIYDVIKSHNYTTKNDYVIVYDNKDNMVYAASQFSKKCVAVVFDDKLYFKCVHKSGFRISKTYLTINLVTKHYFRLSIVKNRFTKSTKQAELDNGMLSVGIDSLYWVKSVHYSDKLKKN